MLIKRLKTLSNERVFKSTIYKNGASERTRTSYPQFRKLLLYPDELRRRPPEL